MAAGDLIRDRVKEILEEADFKRDAVVAGMLSFLEDELEIVIGDRETVKMRLESIYDYYYQGGTAIEEYTEYLTDLITHYNEQGHRPYSYQTSRIYYKGNGTDGQALDHKDIYYNGYWHKALWLDKQAWNCDGYEWMKLNSPVELDSYDIWFDTYDRGAGQYGTDVVYEDYVNAPYIRNALAILSDSKVSNIAHKSRLVPNTMDIKVRGLISEPVWASGDNMFYNLKIGWSGSRLQLPSVTNDSRYSYPNGYIPLKVTDDYIYYANEPTEGSAYDIYRSTAPNIVGTKVGESDFLKEYVYDEKEPGIYYVYSAQNFMDQRAEVIANALDYSIVYNNKNGVDAGVYVANGPNLKKLAGWSTDTNVGPYHKQFTIPADLSLDYTTSFLTDISTIKQRWKPSAISDFTEFTSVFVAVNEGTERADIAYYNDFRDHPGLSITYTIDNTLSRTPVNIIASNVQASETYRARSFQLGPYGYLLATVSAKWYKKYNSRAEAEAAYAALEIAFEDYPYLFPGLFAIQDVTIDKDEGVPAYSFEGSYIELRMDIPVFLKYSDYGVEGILDYLYAFSEWSAIKNPNITYCNVYTKNDIAYFLYTDYLVINEDDVDENNFNIIFRLNSYKDDSMDLVRRYHQGQQVTIPALDASKTPLKIFANSWRGCGGKRVPGSELSDYIMLSTLIPTLSGRLETTYWSANPNDKQYGITNGGGAFMEVCSSVGTYIGTYGQYNLRFDTPFMLETAKSI